MGNVSIKINNGFIRIYIDGILHFCIKREEFLGFQSWLIGEGENRMYIIEYYTKSGEILTEYDNKKLWSKILGLLDKHVLIK